MRGGRGEQMAQALVGSGFGRSEALCYVVQAISETLPNDSTKKQLLDDFLIGHKRV
jgi:hypothetical protein